MSDELGYTYEPLGNFDLDTRVGEPLTDAGLVKSGFGGEQIDLIHLAPGLPISRSGAQTLLPLRGSSGIHEPSDLVLA